jgi:hypothetical protein
MNVKLFSTVPSRKEPFWQIILFPTISILRSPDVLDPYTVVNVEWLFWSVAILSHDKKRLSNDKEEQSYYTDI